ncbi:Tetraspanin family-domain-containing protein [Endogone sp. FLAS-F59071]|nr:Tetraspanin family-domain-containing protein [Endogone sp. FLAS-F59071]|eukprot:RUS21228.1 Tetraspanin family-domain-containing protein [Endogone sp. FLAS-F59071]
MTSMNVFKKIVILTNFLSLVVGLILIGIGSYTFNSLRISQSLSLSLIALGGFITLVSFCGCWGSENEHINLLRVYVVVLILLVLCQIVIGIIAFKHRDSMDEFLDDAWDQAYRKDTKLINNVEQYFECCGFSSPMDRAVPAQCSINYGYVSSCRESLHSTFMGSFQTIGITGAVLGGLEVSIVLLSNCWYLVSADSFPRVEERIGSEKSRKWLEILGYNVCRCILAIIHMPSLTITINPSILQLIGLLCAFILIILIDHNAEIEARQVLLAEVRQLDRELSKRLAVS